MEVGGLKGVDDVMKNLNKELKNIKGRSTRGLLEAAYLVRRDMEPLIPVDTGNLRASWFVVVKGLPTLNASPIFRIKEGKKPTASDIMQITELVISHTAGVEMNKGIVEAQQEPTLIMGFTANYAIFVHEMVGANFSRPGAQAKFFEMTLSKDQNAMLEIIRKHAEI